MKSMHLAVIILLSVAVLLLGAAIVILSLANQQKSSAVAGLGFSTDGKKVTQMQLKDSQSLPLSLLAEDKFGNAVPSPVFDSKPAWDISDPSLGSLEVADDGLSAKLVPSGKLGDCMVQLSAVLSGQALSGELPVTIIPGDATQIIIQPGAPV